MYALQEELGIYSARQFGIKDMELKTVRVRNIVWMGGYTRWSEAYLVTLTDICSFLCVSGQRGTIAKSMHEEHLCVVALTSMERGTQFFPLASYLFDRLLLFVYFQVNNGMVYLDYEDSHHHGPLFSFQ